MADPTDINLRPKVEDEFDWRSQFERPTSVADLSQRRLDNLVSALAGLKGPQPSMWPGYWEAMKSNLQRQRRDVLIARAALSSDERIAHDVLADKKAAALAERPPLTDDEVKEAWASIGVTGLTTADSRAADPVTPWRPGLEPPPFDLRDIPILAQRSLPMPPVMSLADAERRFIIRDEPPKIEELDEIERQVDARKRAEHDALDDDLGTDDCVVEYVDPRIERERLRNEKAQRDKAWREAVARGELHP